MAELSIKEKKIERVLHVDSESITIGRSPESDLVFNDSAISSEHCVIQLAGSDLKIVDLNSRNGTIVNGKRIDEPFLLKGGGEIEVGHVRLTFFPESVPGPRLVVTGPDIDEITLILGEGSLAIGRTPSNDLVLPHDGVSNFHAQITSSGEGFRLQDLGSTNGTRVNDDFVTALNLNDGDRIEVGPYILTLQAAGLVDRPEPGPSSASAESVAPAPSELPSSHVVIPEHHATGAKAITVAAVIAGIFVFLVLVETIARRISDTGGGRSESNLNLLIGNTSFEKGDGEGRTVPGWQVEADVRSVARLTQATARGGISCLEIETESGTSMDSVVSCTYAEDIPVDRTRGYKGVFWVRTRERSGLCLASLEWVDMPSGRIVGEDFGRAVAESADWTRIMVGGVPVEEADRVRLRLVTYGGQGRLFVDDAALYEVPQEKVGTVRYEATLGDCRMTMDPRGLLSLRSEDALLVTRSEFVVDMGGVETRQSFAALAGGYPVMDQSGFIVRGKLCDLTSGEWMKFESVVAARSASARIDCRVWPGAGNSNLNSLSIELFIPSDILMEGGLSTVVGEREIVRSSAFTENNVDQINLTLAKTGISLDAASFDRIVLKDLGRRGFKLVLSKRVQGVPVGGSADLSLVITPHGSGT